MRVSEISERIAVGAVFRNNKIIPKWFVRGKDKHTIKNIEQSWQSKEGDAVLLVFAVNDGVNIYEIRMNQKSLEWMLEKVYVEG